MPAVSSRARRNKKQCSFEHHEREAAIKARVRYLAFLSDDPAELADFYVRHFKLEELGRSTQGDVSTTDGFYNITFLNRRSELHEQRTDTGVHHVGIEVDNLAETLERYRALCPNMPIIDEHGGLHFGDVRIFDPEGSPISLSEGSFSVVGEANRLPNLRHIAYNVFWPEGILNFFKLLFGFRELAESGERRKQGRVNRFAGDGWTNLAIHPFYSPVEGHVARYGINHFGFLVPDALQTVEGFSREIPVSGRPSNRLYAEYRLQDREGNMFDLSQNKGWEVDVDKWERAA
jgi:catechol 2,3-dioxygenase-like lactoylglutathione lyase family enzyme